ncbi:lysine-rich nucleolar protein 1 [Ctenopharyngodon idella]|uniref:lysine-rich nucleolar protein 1 n=1 Tax=Ctenopharyngodon idella TaxID=7959 RepID=UPI002231735F|nr:lysine-rich nucleolar protein 1 [Ctenopharyngodon idella]
MAVDGATKEKKKKKKIKVEDEEADGVVQYAGNTNVVQCHDVSVQTVVKKEPLEVNTRDGENEEKKKKKKKKKIKEEVEAIPVTVCCDASVQTTVKAELSETNISDAHEKTIKKKKSKIKKEPEPLQEEEIISEDGECLVSKKKKAKKKGYTDEVEDMKNKKTKKEVEVKKEQEEEEEEEVDLGHGVETVEKKKKKKRKNEQELNTESEDGETKKKRKKKEADECKEEKQKVKKKKKKKPSAEEELDDITSNEKLEKKSKKQKKNFKGVDEGESQTHANGGHVSSPDKKTKRKVKADNVIEKMEAEPAGKNGCKDDRNKTPEKVKKPRASRAAIVFLSAKPGNQDEVSIDQARRLALQRDIDKESQPEPNLGQWGTVQFDSSDRQAKFLRLMGGFKKSSQPVAGSSGSANMALGKEGQQTLQQGLLGEFERAQSRHMDFKIKGAGLGFTAPSNKKFAIDANARNSIRFDD